MSNTISTASDPRESLLGHPERPHFYLFILFLLVVLSYADRMIIVLFVEQIKADLGISDVQISLIIGLAFAICFGISSPIFGWLSDRYSPRWVIFSGVLVWSAATVACGLSNNYNELFVSRFFVGVGEAALMPAAYSIVSNLFPRPRTARALGTLASGAAIGGSGAMLVGGVIANELALRGIDALPYLGPLSPWQIVFIFLGLPGLFLAPLVFLIPASSCKAAEAEAPHSSGDIWTWVSGNRKFIFSFSLAAGLLSCLPYAITNWTPTFFGRVHGVGIGESGPVLGVITLVVTFSGFILHGVIVDAMTRRGIDNPPYLFLMIISVLIPPLALVAFVISGTSLMSYTAFAAISLLLPFSAVVVAELHLVSPSHLRAQIIALVTTVTNFMGLAVGPTSVAIVTQAVGDDAKIGISIAIVASALCIIALLIMLLSRRAAAGSMSGLVSAQRGSFLQVR